MKTKEEIVKHRFEKSRRLLKDALLLLNDQSFLSAVNRMYYALFYAINAYLTTKNDSVKSHKGVNIKFHKYLVSENLITGKEAKLYYELFERRHEFDYNDFVVYAKNEIKDLFTETTDLINKIESLITTNE